MRSRSWIVALALAVPLTAAAADVLSEYVGPESCKGCHPEAYAAWRLSKHSRAMGSLTVQQQRDARCLSCHSPNLKAQNVESVSCETCHGGGQYYTADYVMKDTELVRMVGLVDPSEKDCRSCHDASSPSLKPFDFVEKLKLIDHWTAEKQRRAQEAAEPEAAAKPDGAKAEPAEAEGAEPEPAKAETVSPAAGKPDPAKAETSKATSATSKKGTSTKAPKKKAK